jgi:hypothetical protein
VKKGWETNDKIKGRFCRKAIRSPRSTGKEAAEWELARASSRGKTICNTVKYFCKILLTQKYELLKCGYGGR